jgi:glycosyltransferase involved in cell wall biosynthesis
MLRDSGVRLLLIEKSSRWHVLAPLVRLIRSFLNERPDVIYAFLPTQTVLSALLLPPWLQTHLVFGLRGEAMDLDHYDMLYRLIYYSEAWLSRRADLIVANAPVVLADAVARGMPRERIAVVANGIDVESMRRNSEAGRALRRAWRIADDAFVIGMIARLDPMKDHSNFLSAAAVFARDHADARFVLVGDGPAAYRAELQALAHSLQLDDRLTWAGEIGGVSAAYSTFDLVSLSSRFGEGFPNVIAEAMSCGTPVVASDVGDAKAIIGDCGEVVPRANPEALSAAWARTRTRIAVDPRLGDAARARIVDCYTVEEMVKKSEELLLALCTNGRQPQ